MKGMRVWSLIQDDVTYCKATKLMLCNYYASMPTACEPQQEMPPHAPALQGRVAPLTAIRESPQAQQRPRVTK